MNSWRLLAEGPFTRDQLRVVYRDEMVDLPPELELEISAHWEKALAASRERRMRLFDGGLFQLEETRSKDGVLTLVLGRSSYRRWNYCAGRGRDVAARFGERFLSRPLACCAAVLSTDDLVLLQKRSDEVAEGAGLFHVPGGHPDPARDLKDGIPDLFGAMESELQEELALDAKYLDGGKIVGLIENLENGKPELLFQYRARLSSREIDLAAKKGSDRYEYDSMSFVAVESCVLAQYEKRLAVPSQALLHLLIGNES